jgi:hypothetical protein
MRSAENSRKREKVEGRSKAADAAMFDVGYLMFDVKARKSSGMGIAGCGEETKKEDVRQASRTVISDRLTEKRTSRAFIGRELVV